MDLRARMYQVAHLGFIIGFFAWMGVRLWRPEDSNFLDLGIGIAIGLTVTFALSFTRLADPADSSDEKEKP